jgi:hypothetical protein
LLNEAARNMNYKKNLKALHVSSNHHRRRASELFAMMQ